MLWRLNRFLLAVMYFLLLHMIFAVINFRCYDESEDEYHETEVSTVVRQGDIAAVKTSDDFPTHFNQATIPLYQKKKWMIITIPSPLIINLLRVTISSFTWKQKLEICIT